MGYNDERKVHHGKFNSVCLKVNSFQYKTEGFSPF